MGHPRLACLLFCLETSKVGYIEGCRGRKRKGERCNYIVAWSKYNIFQNNIVKSCEPLQLERLWHFGRRVLDPFLPSVWFKLDVLTADLACWRWMLESLRPAWATWSRSVHQRNNDSDFFSWNWHHLMNCWTSGDENTALGVFSMFP